MTDKSFRSIGHHKGCFNTLQTRNLMSEHYKKHHEALNGIKSGHVKAGIDTSAPKSFTMIGKDIKSGERTRLRNKRASGAPDWVKITQKGVKDLQKRKSCYPDYGKTKVPIGLRRDKGFVLDFGTINKPNPSGVPMSARNQRNKSKIRDKACKSARGAKKSIVLRDIAPSAGDVTFVGRPPTRMLSPRRTQGAGQPKPPKNPTTMQIQLPSVPPTDENEAPLINTSRTTTIECANAMEKVSLEDNHGDVEKPQDVSEVAAKTAPEDEPADKPEAKAEVVEAPATKAEAKPPAEEKNAQKTNPESDE